MPSSSVEPASKHAVLAIVQIKIRFCIGLLSKIYYATASDPISMPSVFFVYACSHYAHYAFCSKQMIIFGFECCSFCCALSEGFTGTGGALYRHTGNSNFQRSVRGCIEADVLQLKAHLKDFSGSTELACFGISIFALIQTQNVQFFRIPWQNIISFSGYLRSSLKVH